MLRFRKSDRCRICRSERALRTCARRRKDIGWRCCNEMRVDKRCPSECAYALKEDENSPLPAFKADSVTEFNHAIKLYLDLWVSQPQASLDGKTPLAVAAEDSKRLLEWLAGYQYPLHFPMNYLLGKLGLEKYPEPEVKDPESIAADYLNCVIAMEWDKLRQFTINQDAEEDLAQRYKEIIRDIPMLKRANHHNIIHAGIADDGVTAMVYLELNRRYDWTLIFGKQGDVWRLRHQINGSPKLFYELNKRHGQIAQLLSEGKDAQAWEALQEGLKLYPDSADLYYYLGIYWQIVKQLDKAKIAFFDSIALDNDFYAPTFSLGSINLAQEDLDEAMYWFEKLYEKNKEDPLVLNNLGAAYAGKGQIEEAKKLWKKALQIDPNLEPAKRNMERHK
ncbi:MAG: tetratricopeptide repeat protein [Candidatus Cloacimonadaceae bacterium]|jgi:tetratricopeptide (TPR) repeat protein